MVCGLWEKGGFMTKEDEKSMQSIQVRSKVAWKENPVMSNNVEMAGFLLGAALTADNSVIGGVTLEAKLGPNGQKMGTITDVQVALAYEDVGLGEKLIHAATDYAKKFEIVAVDAIVPWNNTTMLNGFLNENGFIGDYLVPNFEGSAYGLYMVKHLCSSWQGVKQSDYSLIQMKASVVELLQDAVLHKHLEIESIVGVFEPPVTGLHMPVFVLYPKTVLKGGE